MAFPTSGLTNNLVHKEGNRAFVYDSTLGVWDQVREADSSNNEILSGTIGGTTNIENTVTFPAGHVTKVTHYPITSNQTITGGTYTSYQVITYSPSNSLSKLYVHHIVNFTMGTGGSARHMWHMIAAGDDITNRTDSSSNYHILSSVSNSFLFYRAQQFPSIDLDGTGTANVTLTFQIQHESAYSNLETAIKGNSDGCMTNTIVTEVY